MKIFKTIRFKITLSFTVLSMVILIIVCFFFYNYFSDFSYRDFDKAMLVVASSIKEAIQEDSLNTSVLSEIKETYIPFTSANDEFLEIINSSGKVILKSEQLKDSYIQVPPDMFKRSLSGEQIFLDQKEPSTYNLWDRHGIRVICYPISYQSQTYVLVVAASLSKIKNYFERIRLILYFSIISALLISIIIGWFFSGRIYHPIDQLIDKANRIVPDNLQSRLPVTTADDVISKLSITLNSMLERIEKAFNTQKRFTSDASHELKTPLTILKGEIEVTLSKNRTEPEYKLVLENLLLEVNRLQKIVENLLLLNELEKGEVDFEQSSININELLTETVSKITPLAKEKNINIRLLLDSANVLTTNGNYGLLFNSFLNLFDNAIKYSAKNKQIECTTALVDHYIIVSIKDHGNGINPDDLDRIFDRFYRSDLSRTRNESAGHGLGLSIVRAIISAHKGTITVTSTQGKGSVFTVKLPVS